MKQTMKSSSWYSSLVALALSAVAFAPPAASAATYTWTGTTSGAWNAGISANWGGTTPTFNNQADVVFHAVGAANLTTNWLGDAARTVRSLTFNANVASAINIGLNNNSTTGRILTFDTDAVGGNATLTMDTAATITLGTTTPNNNGSITLADNLDVTQTSPAGILIISRPINESGGAKTITKSGPGTLRLTAANTFTGAMNVNGGTLDVRNSSSLGTTAGGTTIKDGATLALGGTTLNLQGELVTVAGAGVGALGAIQNTSGVDLQSALGKVVLSNHATFSAATRFDIRDPARSGATGLDLAGFTLTKIGINTIYLDGCTVTPGDIVIQSGMLGLQNGVVMAANAGDTVTVKNTAQLNFWRSASGTNPCTFARDIVIENGGTLSWTGNNTTDAIDQSVASAIDISGTATFNQGGITGSVFELTGPISGTGGINKTGLLELILAGTNSYQGTTAVTAGTLTLKGAHTGGGTYTVASGATLKGDGGSINAGVTVAAGGVLDPTKNGLTLGGVANDLSGATVRIEIDDDTAGTSDTIAFTGTLTLGNAVLDTTDSNLTYPRTNPITLLNGSTAPVTGTFAGLADGATFVAGNQVLQIDYTGGADDFDVVVTPLDEPVVTIAADTSDASEGGTAGFTLTANPVPSGSDLTVTLSYSGTAADGSDFTGQANIKIPATNATADLDLPVAIDGLLEGPESLVVTITGTSSGGSGAQKTASVWLIDGNSAPIDGPALSQTVMHAGAPAALADIVVADEAGGTSRITGIAAAPVFTYNGVANLTSFGTGFSGNDDDDSFILSPSPVEASGFCLEIEFTPTAADVASGANFRSVWDMGGGTNGSGIYLIEGIPHFLCKMNALDTEAASSRLDTDWTGNAICVPLTAVPLPANERVGIALAFSLDSMTYSVNGAPPVVQPLANRTTQTNWRGTPNINIGSIDAVTGQRGGLSTTAGDFLASGYIALANAGAAVTGSRFWNTSAGTVSATAGSPESVTATLAIRGYTSDAVDGSLASTGGGSYASGSWSANGTLAAVNAALADLVFTPGSSALTIVDVTIDDQTSPGSTTGVMIFFVKPTVVYVDDGFTGGRGTSVADADLGAPGNQAAMKDYNAFPTLTAALAAVDPAGTVIVNDGNYAAETIALTGTLTLRLTNTTGGVTVASLGASLSNAIDFQSNTLITGDNTGDNTIACPITGTTGGLTKQGTDLLILQSPASYSGTTTINQGSLRVGYDSLLGIQSELTGDGPVAVAAGARFELNVDLNKSITQTGAISGDGAVQTMGDGMVVFDGTGANPFTGGFQLGDAEACMWNGTSGLKNGFVVISNGNQLGTNAILSRGSQLHASVPGVVVSNDIQCNGNGGLRLGGSHDFELSGTISTSGSTRAIGNYGLNGRTFTLSGALVVNIATNFEASDGFDNGDFLVSADISSAGTAAINVNGNYDGGVVTLTGNNTYAGPTNVNTGTLVMNATHTGGGVYTVASGATLTGTGSTTSTVTVNTGGTLVPGTSTGILSVGGLTLDGTLRAEVNGTATPGTDYDQIVVTGAVDLTGGTLVLDLGSSSITGTAKIISNDDVDAVTGTFTGLPAGAVDAAAQGWTGSVNYAGGDGNDIDLAFTEVSVIGAWRSLHFGSAANAGAGADTGDPNANGFDNLLDFAFGFDPLAGGSGGGSLVVSDGTITRNGPPTIRADGDTGRYFLRYSRRADFGSNGLTYTEQFAPNDLGAFEDTSLTRTVIGTGTGDGGVAIQAVEVEFPSTLPISGSKARFGRLKVTSSP